MTILLDKTIVAVDLYTPLTLQQRLVQKYKDTPVLHQDTVSGETDI
jgi:hypothetical protein